MKLLRADWGKWKRPEKIFPAIQEAFHSDLSQRNLSGVELESREPAKRNGKESPNL